MLVTDFVRVREIKKTNSIKHNRLVETFGQTSSWAELRSMGVAIIDIE